MPTPQAKYFSFTYRRQSYSSVRALRVRVVKLGARKYEQRVC